MKQKLEKAIQYAEEMLKQYQEIGTAGTFGVMTISQELTQARKILDTFDERSEREIKEIVKLLKEIE